MELRSPATSLAGIFSGFTTSAKGVVATLASGAKSVLTL
jgi:hypothetical protein